MTTETVTQTTLLEIAPAHTDDETSATGDTLADAAETRYSEEVLAVGAQAESLIQRVGAILARERARAGDAYQIALTRRDAARTAEDEARRTRDETGDAWAVVALQQATAASRAAHEQEMVASGLYRGVTALAALIEQAMEAGK